jgi:protein gp37/transposase-like protein
MSTAAIEELELSVIVRDPELQPRETLDHETVTQYAEDMLAGIEFPPIRVFFDGGRYWLSQGFHRAEAAEQAGWMTIAAEVIQGSRADAVWDAAGSNKEHDIAGRRRTNADKQRAVDMVLDHPRAKQLSNSEIARHCGVSEITVRRHRKAVIDNVEDAPERLVTRNGTTYPMLVNNIGRRVAPLPATASDFYCSKCGAGFDEEVWHCPGCDHHWLTMDTECKNCHLFVLLDDGSIESIQNTIEGDGDDWEAGKAADRLVEIYDQVAAGGEPLDDYRLEMVDAVTQPKGRATFNQTNEMVEWARWTWNPVTGCEHNCVYCYARDIANRFYAEKFTPTFRPERLEAPRNTSRPEAADHDIGLRNVFVCSMADLFGRWVPEEWITSVFDSCKKSPEWNYLFLTKFPNRYEGLEFPPTSWVGTSIDEQRRVANAEKAFRKVKAPIKWLSLEPLREPLKFTSLEMFDWVVLGGQSRSSGAPEFLPPFDWVAEIVTKAKAAGCKVYIKPNIGFDGPTRPREYPGMLT